MNFIQAALPLLGLLAAGGLVGFLTWQHGKNKKSRGLPTDPLCDFFVLDDDTI